MIRLKLDTGGSHSYFYGNANRYVNGLEELELFRSPPEKVPGMPLLRDALEQYRKPYEGAQNGDRVEAALRDQARKRLTDMLHKVLHYLQSIAAEEDIPALLRAGFEVHRSPRKKPATAPAT